MISEPKLPFPSEPARAGKPDSPAGSAPAVIAPVSMPMRSASFVHRWLRRIGVLLFVFLCATLGVMLMILPWRPEWSDNPLLGPFPALRALVASGFVRGLATGLGALNVWIGFWEAIQYREE